VLGGSDIVFKSLADFPGIMPPEETGSSFLENAILKARYYYLSQKPPPQAAGMSAVTDNKPRHGGVKPDTPRLAAGGLHFEHTGIPVLADDGGLMVDALGGLPGVHSHRWLGREVSDLELAQELVKKVNAIPNASRTARLGGYVAFFDGKELITHSNFVEGTITETLPEDVEQGFPYRSVLVITQFGKLYRNLTHEEHAAVNHRRKNLEALKPQLLKLLKN
jgi:XTP/dITP diphosphohydrolase